MATIQDNLKNLSDEELEQLEKELRRKQIETESGGGLATTVGEGLLRGARGVLATSQGRALPGQETETPEITSELSTFQEKERIKREIKKEFEPEKEEKKTLDTEIRKAVSGEISFDEVREQFPLKKDKIDQVEAERTPVKKSEEFKAGTGGLVSRVKSFASPSQAEITPKTQAVIDQIETQADLDEFVERIDEAEKAGVDVKAILEFFGLR